MKDQIIALLKKTDAVVSGEELSRQLKISRAAIWKNIEELRKEGYVIDATPHLGYTLQSIPDKLYPREVLDQLTTKTIGQTVHYHANISSTMDAAYERARQGAAEGEVVLAEMQSQGRGRMGRVWKSPKDKGIYFSLILRPSLQPTDVAKITLMAGVALCEAIHDVTQMQTHIKWPNDILFEGQKVAGILTEMNAEMDRVHYCILGIGLNVNSSSRQVPEGATSLKCMTGQDVNRIVLTQKIFERLEYWYDQLQALHFDAIFDRWKALSCTIGQHIRIGAVEGKVVDLDDYGALVIEKKNGNDVRNSLEMCNMLDSYLDTVLADLEQKGLLRHLHHTQSAQAAVFQYDDRQILNFCSNNYLGLANDSRLGQAVLECLKKEGYGSGAARLVCGNMPSHDRLEEQLAKFKKQESALLFTSGYMANTGIISSLFKKGDMLFSDRLNHASIMDGIRLSGATLKRYKHNDMAHLEELLQQNTTLRKRCIITDSVFSMDGDMAPLDQIVKLAKQYDCYTMIDEAHALGVLGAHGRGCAEHFGVEKEIDIQMGTFSKAAGSFGAYCVGSRSLISFLINKARSFVYTTGLPPLVAAANCKAIEIIEQDKRSREHLEDNANYMRAGLKLAGFDTMHSITPIIPVLVKESALAILFSKKLFAKGVFVSAIRPPTVPANTARLRLTVMATHTKTDMDYALNQFQKIGKELKVI